MIYLNILRPQHWYKNLLVFLPIIFSLNLLDTELFLLSLQGFILFCLASSGLYIINECFDDIRWSSKGNRLQLALKRWFLLGHGWSTLISFNHLILSSIYSIVCFSLQEIIKWHNPAEISSADLLYLFPLFRP